MQRRKFLKSSSVALAGAALAAPDTARAMMRAENQAGKLPTTEYPPLTGPFRLPAEWYQATTRRFQQKLVEQKLDGAVITSSDNIQYLTGAFATTTERAIWLFVPAKGDPAIFYPGLDRDLWQTWWIKDGEWYFDYHHHGPYNRVVWTAGPTADLFAWMLEGLEKRGHGSSRIGFEARLSDDEAASLRKTTPQMKAEWKTVADTLLRMRQVKTEEELALCRVGIALHDRMMDFARSYILAYGTDATDFEVGHAASGFGAAELSKYLKLDGRPHTGVGVDVGFGCRTGVSTAYPHPNQFFFKKIERGDAIQIAAGVRIGGYGGEGYRAMQIAGPGVGDLHRKMWEVHTAMTLEQQKLMKAGTPCNVVGEGVLKLAKDAGLEKYVYHRPAHGEGSEGHQAPYLALGDTMVLEENMTFSNEPGLYNPEGGFGYNHSNLVRVTKTGGEQFNQTPLTKEWCWITI
ncbi:MAG TPA: Xaa-Pro peptidase family protein [Terriglobales bacterium]|nr:Xaa-Pro peptidase family protein [Terriglobales bacterium]